MHNNLFLNRLQIYTHTNEIAYDEKFHKGINIICGDNSSGKSTISHFIFYILGGAFNDWVKQAKQCSVVYGEVEMNGITLTLKREINISGTTGKGNVIEPIYIYWGNLEASKQDLNAWQKFNYNTTPDKKSFSNVFFENLDIPLVKGENNITFHQILRLLYVDQDSPTSSLFLYEQFDTTFTRETVSNLLLGVYSQEIYDKKQRQIEAEKELDDVKKEIKVLKQFIPNSLDLFPAHIRQNISNKEEEISNLESNLIQLREQNKTVIYTKKTKLEFEKLNIDSIAQRNIVKNIETKIQDMKMEYDDSVFFIESLEVKIKAIKNSILTRTFLGEFPLDYCPECLEPINVKEDHVGCKLCKENSDNTNGISQAKKIEQELSFQIKESKSLLLKRERLIIDLKASYENEKLKLHQLQIQVNSALNDVKSVRDERIDNLFLEKGLLEGEIMQLRTLLENAELYQSLVSKKTDLDKELNFLTESINTLVYNQDKLKKVISDKIEEKGLFLLNNDLERQDDFIAAKEFNVDYRNNIAFIADKNAKFSASSNFYLKTSARFAIFLASLEMNKMRYPRFILCDNMEDKGIEEIRAQNFQNNIIEQSEKHDSNDYQIIYTTSYLPEHLKGSSYIVGEYYTKASRSLKNVH